MEILYLYIITDLFYPPWFKKNHGCLLHGLVLRSRQWDF